MEALGRHIIAELYGCSASHLSDAIYIEQSMIAAARNAGATVLNSNFHHFSPFGVSGVVVIQESHLAIHTWPEYSFASLDVFTCGSTVDPWKSYHWLKEAMKAEHGSATELWRGSFNLLQKNEQLVELRAEKQQTVAPKLNRNTWFTELNEDTAFSLRHSGHLLYKHKSKYQEIKIYETSKFGNVLVLDGLIMCTEKDEYVYHEMIAHVPMLTHSNPKRALVIGGGDGGTVRELLRHENLEEVVLVEIDEYVIEAARKYLPTISVALDHPKLKIKVADGIQYVREVPDNQFDLIIVDSTDPVGPAEGLFNQEFYQQTHRCLTENGILVTQSESPVFNQETFKAVSQCHKSIFGLENVWSYLTFIPTYPMGMWSFSYASKGKVHPLTNLNFTRSKSFTQKHQLRYYNEEIHSAAFALPTFVRSLLQTSHI